MNHFKTNILTLALFLLAFTTANAEISISTVQYICGPSSPGGVTIVATGTVGPFTFQWSGPEEGYNNIKNEESCNLRTPVRDRHPEPRRVKNPGERTVLTREGTDLGRAGKWVVNIANEMDITIHKGSLNFTSESKFIFNVFATTDPMGKISEIAPGRLNFILNNISNF